MYNNTAVIKVLNLTDIIDILSTVYHQTMYEIEIQVIQCFYMSCIVYYYFVLSLLISVNAFFSLLGYGLRLIIVDGHHNIS